MLVKSKVFYPKEKARECSVLSCYALKLKLIDNKVVDGYYYCGHFYYHSNDITEFVSEWMIPYEGESVRCN